MNTSKKSQPFNAVYVLDWFVSVDKKTFLDLICEEQEQAAVESRGWDCRHDFAGIEINRWDEAGKEKRVDWRLKKSTSVRKRVDASLQWKKAARELN